MSKTKAFALPDNLITLLSNVDKQKGFPVGTMLSVMQQEVGGQAGKFINDPSAYHYEKNDDGKRIAGHTGKVSTAFGPFGILESTGAKPGYGVEPLKDKSIEEQVRFAGDYLAARSKQAGSLVGGLSGYGEGAKYGQQVAARVGAKQGAGGMPTVAMNESKPVANVSVPAAPMEFLSVNGNGTQASTVIPTEIAAQQLPADYYQQLAAKNEAPVPMTEEEAWARFQASLPKEEVTAQDLNYGIPIIEQNIPKFNMPQLNSVSTVPNFSAFKAWGRQRA